MSAFWSWVLKVVMEVALAKAEEEATYIFKGLEEEKKRGVIDGENEKAYTTAKSRADRIKAANALLNGDKLPTG